MTGTVDDCNVDSARTRQASDQTSLHQYGGDADETFVGIVHSPNDELRSVCDEIDERLAPPYNLFTDWIEERDENRSEMSYVNAHNTAFDSVNYHRRFVNTLDDQAIDEYADRVQSGETIVFVCYCSNGCYCHRKIVKEKVHERVQS